MDDRASQNLLAANDSRASLTRRLRLRYGDEAEDFVGEAIVSVADSPSVEHPKAWASHKAEGLAVDACRHRASARRNAWKVVGPVALATPEEAVEDRDLKRRAVTEWAALPEAQRAAVRAYADGASHSEIAQQLGRSVYAAKHLVQRGLQKLRERLHDAELGVAVLAARVRRRAGNVQATLIGAASSATLLVQGVAVGLTVGSSVLFPQATMPTEQRSHLAGVRDGPARTIVRAKVAGHAESPLSIPPPSTTKESQRKLAPHKSHRVAGRWIKVSDPDAAKKSAGKYAEDAEDSHLRDGDVAGFLEEVNSCVRDRRIVVSPSFVGCRMPER